ASSATSASASSMTTSAVSRGPRPTCRLRLECRCRTARTQVPRSRSADKMIVLRNGHQPQEPIMTNEPNPASPAPIEAETWRRELSAAAVPMAAAAGVVTGAEAQTPPSNLRFVNPPGMSNPPGYSHVVEVTGPFRMAYFAGQTGADANGKVSADFRTQAVQVF